MSETRLRSRPVMNPNRRQLLHGAGLAAGGVVLSAFAGAKPAFAQEGKKGGRLRIGVANGATTDSLDPAVFITSHQKLIGFSARNSLFEIGADNKIKGELVDDWTTSSDATRWMFRIRKGVEFHSGKTLTGKDLVASINHHRLEGSKSPLATYFKSVSSIEAPSPDTVVVVLSQGDADFLYMLADFHINVGPADEAGNAQFASGDGTGGYSLVDFQPGVSSFHKRFANYWKPDSAFFDEAEVRVIEDPTARISALNSGEVDTIDEVDLKTLSMLQQNPSISLDETLGGMHATMPMMADVAPYNSNDVRMALKYAFNRQAMVDTVLSGRGVVGNDNPISANMPYYRTFPQRQYDPDQAKFYLKKAGMSSLKVSLSTAEAAFVGGVDAALLFKSDAAAAGIDVEVVQEPNDAYWGNVWSKKPFIMSSWTPRPTPGVLFALAYASSASWNESHFRSERFDQLLAEARPQTDQAKRAELYGEMQAIVRDEGATIVPFFRSEVSARQNQVTHGAATASNLQLDGMKCIERWWFA